MPIEKFRSVEAMPPPPRAEGDDLARRIATAWRRAFQLCPPAFSRGVKRFQTMEEANRDRSEMTIRRMRERAGGG